ncbi:MAG: KOW domain-containing RNA-binding protein [Oscillospiraceae bacterium]|nr:KOW domain-containing RNA-binding protein [Oscillospiraceae bacterium]
MKIEKGRVVKALAGRDSGRFFVIVDIGEKFVEIADGKTRKLKEPKTKSLKHLMLTNTVTDIDGITDKKLRKVLSAFYDAAL